MKKNGLLCDFFLMTFLSLALGVGVYFCLAKLFEDFFSTPLWLFKFFSCFYYQAGLMGLAGGFWCDSCFFRVYLKRGNEFFNFFPVVATNRTSGNFLCYFF